MVREAFVEPSWVALKKSPMRSILGVGLIFRRRTLVLQLIGFEFSAVDPIMSYYGQHWAAMNISLGIKS